MRSLLQFNELYKYIIVGCRFAGLIFFMPGYGDAYVHNRIRIVFILTLTVALTPLIQVTEQNMASSPWTFLMVIASELGIGFFLATLLRFVVAAADTAGTIISFQIGLSNVFSISTAVAQQTSIVGTFLGVIAVLIIFITDLHIVIIQTLLDSYKVFVPGVWSTATITAASLLHVIMSMLETCFRLALQLAAPIIAISLLVTLSGAIMNRIIPQIPIFFLLQPLQTVMGLLVMIFTLTLFAQAIYSQFVDAITEIRSSLSDTMTANPESALAPQPNSSP